MKVLGHREPSRKIKILGRMPHNLDTPEHPMTCNDRDFRDYLRAKGDHETRRSLRGHLVRRRFKAVTLVEELSIRTQKVQPLMKRLEQISERMSELMRQLKAQPGPARQGGSSNPAEGTR
ncbi:MAG: hypothetical protein U0800_09845 [Isosphaeraceae bacterium]